RPEVPDTLQPQFAASKDFFEAFGWTVAVSENMEADDLLGSYATRETAAGGRTLVMTGDRDMFQTVDDSVQVLYVRTGGKQGAELVDTADVKRRYGIPPELVPDFIALRGDPSDGIPGAKGAAELLQRHGSLETAIEHGVRETKKTVRAALCTQGDELRAYKAIATLQDVDVEMPVDRPTDYSGA